MSDSNAGKANDTHPVRRARRTRVQLESDIHDAVRAALEDCGYGGLTFKNVAERADVSKPVLYRRFRDRPSMVLHTLRHAMADLADASADDISEDSASTGSLREDLRREFDRTRSRAVSIGDDTFRGLVGEADPATLADIAGFSEASGTELRSRIIGPAVARGELGTSPIPDAVLLTPYHLMRDAIVFTEPIPDTRHLVDDIALPLYRTASTDSASTE